MAYNQLNEEKKRKLRQWVFSIGYIKAKEALEREHNNCFLNMGVPGGKYDKKKSDRLEEMAESLHYVKMLEEINAQELDIFK